MLNVSMRLESFFQGMTSTLLDYLAFIAIIYAGSCWYSVSEHLNLYSESKTYNHLFKYHDDPG